jgi:glycosyltransferase involved in cell wall biosynthesis
MKLSIIIPTREEEKAIAGTVAQFKALSIEHEIIVSDGGSKDHTVERARLAAHVVIVYDGRKHNASIGRNDGAKIAKGEFLCFIDADVVIPEPQKFFERALSHFDEKKIVGVCGPQRALPHLATWADKVSFGYLNAIIRLQNNILHRGETSGKFMLVRRDAFEHVHGFREDLVTREDGDFFYRLSKVGKTVFDPKLIVYHGARRAHQIGWPKLWYVWTKEILYFWIHDKSQVDDWTPMR